MHIKVFCFYKSPLMFSTSFILSCSLHDLGLDVKTEAKLKKAHSSYLEQILLFIRLHLW